MSFEPFIQYRHTWHVLSQLPTSGSILTAFNLGWVHIMWKSASRCVSFVIGLSSVFIYIYHWRWIYLSLLQHSWIMMSGPTDYGYPQTMKCFDLSMISQMRSTAWEMNVNYEFGSIWKEVATMCFRSTIPAFVWRNNTEACQKTMPVWWFKSWFYQLWIRSDNYHIAAVIATKPVNCASNYSSTSHLLVLSRFMSSRI